jgi:SET domain-containing protein 6
MGSCILSRSFSLGEPDVGEGKNSGDEDTSTIETAMDVDETPSNSSHTQPSKLRTEDDGHDSNEHLEAEDDDEDDDDPDSDVAMVPLADMLNARHGANNARYCPHPVDPSLSLTSDRGFAGQAFS